MEYGIARLAEAFRRWIGSLVHPSESRSGFQRQFVRLALARIEELRQRVAGRTFLVIAIRDIADHEMNQRMFHSYTTHKDNLMPRSLLCFTSRLTCAKIGPLLSRSFCLVCLAPHHSDDTPQLKSTEF